MTDSEEDLCVAPRIKALLLRTSGGECVAAIEHFQHYPHAEATAAVEDFAKSCPQTYFDLSACSKEMLIAYLMAHHWLDSVKAKP